MCLKCGSHEPRQLYAFEYLKCSIKSHQNYNEGSTIRGFHKNSENHIGIFPNTQENVWTCERKREMNLKNSEIR